MREEGVVDLTDLGLVLRKVEFGDTIADVPAAFFSETEITNGMYADFLADTDQSRDDSRLEKAKANQRDLSTASTVVEIHDFAALWRKGAFPKDRRDHPVSFVSIDEATKFCKWLDIRYKLPGLFRLPTEEEWLFAAYGTDRKFPWGDAVKEYTAKSTEPVKARPDLKTPTGLYGMWGNVSELVLSPWDGYGGKINDKYTPWITRWLGESYRTETIRGEAVKPRQDDWGYTHSRFSRSDEWGFRVVFIPDD